MDSAIIHYPRLDTVLMIEDAIKDSGNYLTKTQLWRSLPKKVMYQTYSLVITYLLDSRKIIIDHDRKIVWVFADNPKNEKLLAESVKRK